MRVIIHDRNPARLAHLLEPPPHAAEFRERRDAALHVRAQLVRHGERHRGVAQDRKSTRLNSSHLVISYAVFCLKKKKKTVTCTRAARAMAVHILSTAGQHVS